MGIAKIPLTNPGRTAQAAAATGISGFQELAERTDAGQAPHFALREVH
jgi:hypothetical protein